MKRLLVLSELVLAERWQAPVTHWGRDALTALVVGLLALVLSPPLRAQQIEWVRQFGTSNDDLAHGISANASGVYVVGATRGGGVGFADVRKYDTNGSELWTRQFSAAEALGVSAGASDVYVTGSDAFVRKYDTNGNEVWTQFTGAVASEISVDASGVYVAGHTWGTLPGQSSAGYADAFVRKYDTNGNEIWTRQFGTPGIDEPSGIAVDASGVYVAGWTDDALGGASNDVFVRKYDPNGNEVWTRQFGTSGFDIASGITVDVSGAYVAGSTFGTLPGQSNAGGAPDVFVRKYDPNGNEVWTRQFGTSTRDSAAGISVDVSGVYVAGSTLGTFPGHSSAGSYDVFVRKYDPNGNEVWTRQFGTSSGDEAFGISVNAAGLYVAGRTSGTFPGQSNAGGSDAFVAKRVLQTPAEVIQQLIADVVALNLQQGISNSLDAKLQAAVEALDDVKQNNNVAAINALQAFINAVEAQRGVHISNADADTLIASTQQIIAMLGG